MYEVNNLFILISACLCLLANMLSMIFYYQNKKILRSSVFDFSFLMNLSLSLLSFMIIFNSAFLLYNKGESFKSYCNILGYFILVFMIFVYFWTVNLIRIVNEYIQIKDQGGFSIR
jgi:hypothetical protein